MPPTRGAGWCRGRRVVCSWTRSRAHHRLFVTIPQLLKSLRRLLDAFRPCFTTVTVTTFLALTTGVIAAPARRTVCGMLTAARMAGVWHHSRAHRFFATARWSLDHLGLTMAGLIVGWLTPACRCRRQPVPAQRPPRRRRVPGPRRLQTRRRRPTEALTWQHVRDRGPRS
ncbi:transposase [Kutzneria albida]|uniref:transposase n=1 Tax=Kutzneria albida TaxID=43357 RepID=UPI0009DEEA55